jgi:hypothetical protein
MQKGAGIADRAPFALIPKPIRSYPIPQGIKS